MTTINLQISKKMFSPKLFPLLEDYSHRFEIYKGSAGSGKSYFITQKIVYRCLKEPIRVAVCRRYATTLRNSCFQLFKDVLNSWKLTSYMKIRETDMDIKFPNGSEIIFLGLDEETKLLSLANISCIFVEEVFEVEQSKFEQLDLRMRGKAKQQQIIAAFNPISSSHWLFQFCEVQPPQSFYYSKTTYLDNPFISEDYKNSIEEYRTRNPYKWKIYGLGEWGSDPEGLVFNNWRKEDFDLNELLSLGLKRRTGSDLGFIDPTTIVDTLYDEKNKRIYVFNEYYATGKQLDEVAAAMASMELTHQKVFMDAAEPRSIDFFRRKGFNTVPCIKGADSVRAGISFLQNLEIVVSPKCKHLIEELSNFSYVKDRRTEKYQEDKYTHEWSHAIDGLRYAYSDIYTNKRLKTFDKKLLGI